MFLTKKESGFSMHLPGFSLKSFFLLSVFLFLLFCLGGCSSSGESSGTETAKRDNTPVVLIPTADGTKTIEDSVITIDISNTSRGYIMAAYHGDAEKVNIQLTGPMGQPTFISFVTKTALRPCHSHPAMALTLLMYTKMWKATFTAVF